MGPFRVTHLLWLGFVVVARLSFVVIDVEEAL